MGIVNSKNYRGDVSGEGWVYDEEMVRRLCAEAANEQDPERSQELIALLQAVLRDDVEELKLRASYLAKCHAMAAD
jgi:hypothetical protein